MQCSQLMRTLLAVLVAVAPLVAPAAALERGEPVSLAEIPPAARKALEQEAASRSLAHVRRVVDERGCVAYRASVPGTGRSLEVAPDGRVIWRHWAGKY